MKKLGLFLVLFTFTTINLQAQEATDESLTKLYIATFDRAPDKDGLTYWLNTKMPLEDIATSFFDQPETQEKYPNGYSIIDFINAIYFNLFKRTPDQVGGDYWYKELDKNGLIKSKFILAIINGAKDDDAKILDNKTEVGLAFVNSGSNDVSMARDIMLEITADISTVAPVTKPTPIVEPIEVPTTDSVVPVVKPAPIVKPVVVPIVKPTPIAKPVVAPVEIQTPKPKEQDEKEEEDDLPTD